MMKEERAPSKAFQRNRFTELARVLGADEDESAFKAKLAVIARQKPKDELPSATSATKNC